MLAVLVEGDRESVMPLDEEPLEGSRQRLLLAVAPNVGPGAGQRRSRCLWDEKGFRSLSAHSGARREAGAEAEQKGDAEPPC